MGMRQILLSRWFYYFFITLGLFSFILVILPYFIQNQIISPDLGRNLFSEGWGILFTLLFLVMIFELRDWFQWKSVREQVFRRLGSELQYICYFLLSIVDVGNAKERIRHISNLKGKIALNSTGEEFFVKPKESDNIVFMRRILKGQQYLSEIETKYFRFIDPKLRLSIMKVQIGLEELGFHFELRNAFIERGRENAYLDMIESDIRDMLTEIYKIYEMGIEISF